jgi:predicted ATPase/class 3 adenylate cyclase
MCHSHTPSEGCVRDPELTFGAWLRRRRLALDLTREELAARVACSVSALRRFESDELRPSRPLAEALANALQLTPADQATFINLARDIATDTGLPTALPAAPAAPIRPDHAGVQTHALPHGTVTFLFTDIAGSTRLWEQHQHVLPDIIERHHAILNAIVAAQGGVVFKTVGDGVLAAFAQAPPALAAAYAAQRAMIAEPWGLPAPLQIRMALHSGGVEQRDGDYFGPALNRASRLLAAGHGGQVLLSLATEQLVREQLPADTILRDLGTHSLKDLSLPERIFQLVAADLPQRFPALHTLDGRRTNLLAQPTMLLGREQDVAAVVALLDRAAVRLVTLTGPGGIGKTRLSVQVAAELIESFADGVYFVDLAPIRDPQLVSTALAETLGVRETSGQPILALLKEYLRNKRLLLVLDNFEHLLDAAPLVAELLAHATQMKVLVTSRAVLHVRGEHEVVVSPLALPDLAHLPPREQLTQYAAVALFIQRAQASQPSFQITTANAPAVAEICARLDGLPLAIELAAARIKLFSPEALLARLSAPLALLTGGARDLPTRQQTIRNTIAWSYNLLNNDEQTLFRRLGVFVGGFTLEAAEAVCNGDDDLLIEVVDRIAALVDKSLLRKVDGPDGATRFMLLETIREYALERLAEAGAVTETRQRHAEYFVALAETAHAQLHGRERGAWLDQLEVEHDNLRAALAWALAGGDREIGARIAIALVGRDGDGLWSNMGYRREGLRWLGAVLAQRDALAPGIQAWALLLKAVHQGILDGNLHLALRAIHNEVLAFFRTVDDRSGIANMLFHQGFAEEALGLYQDLGDHYHCAIVLHGMGDMARDQGDTARALVLLEQSMALCSEYGYVGEPARILNSLGDVACIEGDLPRATACYWEALALAQGDRAEARSAWLIGNLARLALVQGDDGRVLTLLHQQVAWLREQASLSFLIMILPALGRLVNAHGDHAQARAILRDGLILQQQFAKQSVYSELIESLEAFAGLFIGQGQAMRAVRLLGAAEALRRTNSVPMPPSAGPAYKQDIATLRAQHDEATFEAAWATGQALTLEQAIAEALETSAIGQ